MPLLYLAQSDRGPRHARGVCRRSRRCSGSPPPRSRPSRRFYTMLPLASDRASTWCRVHEPVVRAPRRQGRVRGRAPGRRHPARRGALRRRRHHAARGGVPRARARWRRSVQIDFVYHDDVTPERMRELIADCCGGRRARSVARRADARLPARPRACWPAWRRWTREPRSSSASSPRTGATTACGRSTATRRRAATRAAHGPRRWRRDDVIQVVKDSGLRGRGGAGLPDGHEVVVRAAGHRQAHVRHRELRRIGAGHVQQPRADGARAAPDCSRAR